MTHIANKINDLNCYIESFREEFTSFIQDKDIPLEKRWKVFADAPSDLKNHDTSLVRFNCLGQDDIGYEGRVCHLERYQTVTTNQLVENYMDYLFCRRDYSLDTQLWEFPEIALLMEEILAMNLGSFTYDW